MSSFTPVTTDDVSFVGTDPLPTRPYCDPAYFELERQAVFKRAWLHIGRVEEVAERGRYIVRPIEALRASILVTRAGDGTRVEPGHLHDHPVNS